MAPSATRQIARPSLVPDQGDFTAYMVVNDYEPFGVCYVETNLGDADLETIIQNFVTGQYDQPLRVVAFNTAEGWSHDVSEDIAREVLDRAVDADRNLSDGTKAFIDRYVGDLAAARLRAD